MLQALNRRANGRRTKQCTTVIRLRFLGLPVHSANGQREYRTQAAVCLKPGNEEPQNPQANVPEQFAWDEIESN